MECIVNAKTRAYLPKQLASLTGKYETDSFHYDHTTESLDCKLLTDNLYQPYFKQVYPPIIHDHELTDDMLDTLKSYTDSRSNQCYMKTNLNLLSANLDEIDWTYVNRLRSLIRGLVQTNVKHSYYRGLTLSDREIRYYQARRDGCYYTNSFTSFTVDRLLIYAGNAILILTTDNGSDRAKKNLANIWQWSADADEKEALLAVGTKLKILSVHYYGCKWEIEVTLAED